ncbi:hypothetical protein LTR94_034725, partial [Friedmanniomyces endolithicus]
WPRNCTPTRIPATRPPRNGSSASPPPSTCWATPRSAPNMIAARSTPMDASSFAASAAGRRAGGRAAAVSGASASAGAARAVPAAGPASTTSIWKRFSALSAAAGVGPGAALAAGAART